MNTINSEHIKNIFSRLVSIISDMISPIDINAKESGNTPDHYISKDILNRDIADILAKTLTNKNGDNFNGGADFSDYLKFTCEKDHSDIVAKIRNSNFIKKVIDELKNHYGRDFSKQLHLLTLLNDNLILSVSLHPSGRHTLMCKVGNSMMPFDIMTNITFGNFDEKEFYSFMLRLYHWLSDIKTNVKISLLDIPDDFIGVIINMENKDAIRIYDWVRNVIYPNPLIDDDAETEIVNNLVLNYLDSEHLSIPEKKFGYTSTNNLCFRVFSNAILVPVYYYSDKLISDKKTRNFT